MKQIKNNLIPLSLKKFHYIIKSYLIYIVSDINPDHDHFKETKIYSESTKFGK